VASSCLVRNFVLPLCLPLAADLRCALLTVGSDGTVGYVAADGKIYLGR
jgi:hypothetical protein